MVAVPRDFKGVPDLYWIVRKKRIVIKQTSLAGYLELLNSGQIAERALLRWECVRRAGPCCGSELFAYMDTNNLIPSGIKDRRAFCTRELRRMQRQGYLITMDERDSVVTGRSEIVWAVTNWPPLYPPKLQTEPSLAKLLPQGLKDLRFGLLFLLSLEIRRVGFEKAFDRFSGSIKVLGAITKDGL